MLGRLRMTIADAIKAYKEISPTIFKKKWWTQQQPLKYFGAENQHYWFEGKNVKDTVQRLLSSRGLDPDLMLCEGQDVTCRV